MKLRSLLASLAVVVGPVAFGADLKVEKYTLPNGMTVILHEDHTAPIACVNIWYHVGSKDESDRRSGFAHLFEHLMFMGTDRAPNGQFDKIMEAGGGQNNASTAEDRTNYFESGPASLLPTLLWLEADRLEDLGRTMTQKKLDLQREVVRNERRQTTENTPYGKAFEALNGLMYPLGHPYHTSVIGSHEDLEAATVKDVQDFFATFYVPNNASMVVAGDFDSKEIKPLIARLFGTLERKNDPPRKSLPGETRRGVRRMTMVGKVQAPRTIMSWRSAAAFQPGDVELNLASLVLAGGVSSRLYRRLVADEKLATDVAASQDSRSLGSTFTIVATLAKGASLDRLEAAIDDEVAKFAKSGPSPDELRRFATAKELETAQAMQSIMAKADRMNEFEFYLGEPNAFDRALKQYRDATPSAVRDVARKTFDPTERLVLRVVPASEVATGTNPRTATPPPMAARPFTPPVPETFKLANGVNVVYFHRPEVAVESVRFRFGAGADSEILKNLGATSLMADSLSQGAGSRDSAAFDAALNQAGATFGVSVGRRQTVASVDGLARTIDDSLKLAADALRRPKFGATEFERTKRLTLAAIEQSEDSPTSVASRVGAREFFGKDHPRGRRTSGEVDTVKGLDLDAVKLEYSRVVHPSTLTIFAAGAVDTATMRKKLEATFGDWRSTATAIATPEAEPPKNDRFRVVIVDKPGAPQTVVRFMAPSAPYGSPDRPTLEAFATTLAGTFTSRLNQNLREDKGYTYGAGGGFSFEARFGMFTASAEVRTDVTGASIKEMFAEFDRIAKGDVTDAEAGKSAATERNGIVEGLTSLDGLLGSALRLFDHERPFSALESDYRVIGTIDANAINAVAAHAFDRSKGLLVLVGDRAEIEKQLAGLALPKIEIVK